MIINKVTRLIEAKCANDGRIVSATFGTQSLATTLEFPAEILGTILQDLSGVLRVAESKSNLATQGFLGAGTPHQTRAAKAANEEVVLVSFRMANGLEYHFALPTKQASDFAQKIFQAVETPTKDQPRH